MVSLAGLRGIMIGAKPLAERRSSGASLKPDVSATHASGLQGGGGGGRVACEAVVEDSNSIAANSHLPSASSNPGGYLKSSREPSEDFGAPCTGGLQVDAFKFKLIGWHSSCDFKRG